MKETTFVKLSQDHKETQKLINSAIFNIDTTMNVSFLPNLCKVTDPYKYMLVYEHKLGLASVAPSVGVKVVKCSSDMKKTNDQLNEVMSILRNKGNLNFLNISQQDEYTYIILYEYKAGGFPYIKIVPIIEDSYNAKYFIDNVFEDMYEDEMFDLEPFDSFMINKNNMIILFG